MNALSQRIGNKRVVLAHDWLTGMRGGERVLSLHCRAFPEAPLATLLAQRSSVTPEISGRALITSPLQHIPGIQRTYRYWLPLMPAAAACVRIPACDLLLSTSHCVAKSFRAPPGGRHVCYCFTPMRYAWLFHDEYLGHGGALRILARPILAWLRRWDRKTSARVDHFIAISRHVRERIERFYGRDAAVVYPPVDTGYFTPAARTGDAGKYDLVVSALVPYKKIDLAVRAYNRNGFPLWVAGDGSGSDDLKAMAGANIHFLGRVSDAKLLELYRGCRQLVFPGEEDFGIVPLEAQATGRPVVAYARGGALETVVEGQTGLFFHSQSEEALLDAVERSAAMAWDVAHIRRHAEKFGVQRYLEEMGRNVHAGLS